MPYEFEPMLVLPFVVMLISFVVGIGLAFIFDVMEKSRLNKLSKSKLVNRLKIRIKILKVNLLENGNYKTLILSKKPLGKKEDIIEFERRLK